MDYGTSKPIRKNECTLKSKSQAGFTLIELMISLTIILIVTAIAIPNFQKAGERSQISGCNGNQKIIKAQLENYFLINNQYPRLVGVEGLHDFYEGTIVLSEHTEYQAAIARGEVWYPIDMLTLKNEGYLQEIAICPRGGFYLIKIGNNGRAEGVMCSMLGEGKK